ncbi:hypothetical protein [Xanthomonas sp. D-109]|uniref:hypothetical protein n=1 Tax=Xanthomonas sp. D-109 TaxID=2821274 RepID=UPI001ADC997E|nr:hypothetical protein [Xanthomonas sp. D-109]MBO9880719.1 hypothetical protein [Xanthomonas sp. D-109]
MMIRTNREDVALEILKKPECFKSLPQRTEFERKLCLWRAPSFSTHSSWSIFQPPRSTNYIVRRLEHNPHRGLPINIDDPHIFGAEALVCPELVAQTITSFETLVLPMFRKPQGVGIDGTGYGVIFGNLWQGTNVNWWGENPAGWSPLAILFQQTIELLDSFLPTSTLRTTGV